MTNGHTSTAAIRGHPIHPMVVPFPIAFLVGTFVSDGVFVLGGDPFWAVASKWLLVGGLGMAAIAAIAGLVDFFTIRVARTGAVGWIHLIGNVTAVVLAFANLLLRWTDPVEGAYPVGLMISAVVTLILVITGWMGGELVFRYRVGVMDSATSERP